MKNSEYKLDNPVWHSLSEKQQEFSIESPRAKFYNPIFCPFGAWDENENIEQDIDDYAELTESFFIVGEKPRFSNRVILEREVACLQMIFKDKVAIEISENIVLLSAAQQDMVFDLVDAVQPGYFNKKTMLMGNYYGIFKDGKLVAAAGERMRMKEFTEISAIVTHPDYTGNGFAQQLTSHVIEGILSQKSTPFLHVLETNRAAIKLYEKLGFIKRRKMSLWNFKKKP